MLQHIILLLTTVAMASTFLGSVAAEIHLGVDAITIHSRNGVSIDFIFVPPGEYVVGQNIGRVEVVLRALGQQGAALDEGPERRITFKHGFYLARHQITASQFALFLNSVEPKVADQSIVVNGRSNISKNAGRYIVREGASRYPANTVTWTGAVEFTKWFKKQSKWAVRLPSESEWEAAARTPNGFLTPTGGPERKVDPKTGLLPGIRAGKADADVDAFEENVTVNGLVHTLSSVGDWTSDIYRSDRAGTTPDILISDYEGGHVLKRCLNDLTEREAGGDVGENGVFGLRVLLEATESGSPLRVMDSDQ